MNTSSNKLVDCTREDRRFCKSGRSQSEKERKWKWTQMFRLHHKNGKKRSIRLTAILFVVGALQIIPKWFGKNNGIKNKRKNQDNLKEGNAVFFFVIIFYINSIFIFSSCANIFVVLGSVTLWSSEFYFIIVWGESCFSEFSVLLWVRQCSLFIFQPISRESSRFNCPRISMMSRSENQPLLNIIIVLSASI